MNSLLHLRHTVAGLCAAATVLLSFSTAQAQSEQTTTNPQQAPHRHHLGVGTSLVGGDITFGRPALLFSGLYAYAFSEWFALEGSGQFTYFSLVQNVRQPANLDIMFWASNAAFVDVTGMVNVVGKLYAGVGATVRWYSHLVTQGYITTDANGQQTTTASRSYSQGWSLGGTVKLEQRFPLSSASELTLRGQFHLLGKPVSLIENYNPYNPPFGAMSLGAFLRLGW